MSQDPWLFEDPPNLAVFTNRHIVEGACIHFVSHDEEGDWTFLDETCDLSEAKLVSLASIVKLDPGLVNLADLPRGWSASRQGRTQDWKLEDNRPLYTLDNASETNAQFPDTFPIPSTLERTSLKVGDLVKLLFRIRTQDTTLVERMWVRVEEVLNETEYVGILDNDAFSNPEIRSGLCVEFAADDVVEIVSHDR